MRGNDHFRHNCKFASKTPSPHLSIPFRPLSRHFHHRLRQRQQRRQHSNKPPRISRLIAFLFALSGTRMIPFSSFSTSLTFLSSHRFTIHSFILAVFSRLRRHRSDLSTAFGITASLSTPPLSTSRSLTLPWTSVGLPVYKTCLLLLWSASSSAALSSHRYLPFLSLSLQSQQF